jgi:Flp pilus assembly protein TadG
MIYQISTLLVSPISRAAAHRPYLGRPLAGLLPPVWRNEGGAVAIMAAVAMLVLCGVVGLGIDLGMWYRAVRLMQNAADSAAIAASKDGTSSYQSTGEAVAAQYGFTNGVDGITVTITNNQTCPNGQTNCYSAAVTQASAQQFFSTVLGFSAPTLSAGAMASGGQTHPYCLLALAYSGTDPAILSNGGPKADLSHCGIMSNTGMTCHGHNLNADYGDAHGVNSGCGIVQDSYVPKVADPYSGFASSIPSNTCNSYPQEPAKKKDPPLPASNQWSGAKTLAATTIICGDLQLTGDTTLTTASSGSVLVIENGQLDTNGYTLQTASGSALTVIFSGTAGTYTHAPTGGGTFNIEAPKSGTWHGIAIYQDPALSTGVDISAAGNSPTWDITGLVYLPHSSVTFSGAVNKSSNGASCFVMVVDNITINGTGSILDTGGCVAAGLTMPSDTVGGSTSLVQ